MEQYRLGFPLFRIDPTLIGGIDVILQYTQYPHGCIKETTTNLGTMRRYVYPEKLYEPGIYDFVWTTSNRLGLVLDKDPTNQTTYLLTFAVVQTTRRHETGEFISSMENNSYIPPTKRDACLMERNTPLHYLSRIPSEDIQQWIPTVYMTHMYTLARSLRTSFVQSDSLRRDRICLKRERDDNTTQEEHETKTFRGSDGHLP